MKRLLCVAVSALMLLTVLMPTAGAAKDKVALNVTIRDFLADGLLFEGNIESAEGMVQSRLGEDKKPVFNLTLWQELYNTEVYDEQAGDYVPAEVSQSMLQTLYNNTDGVNMPAKKTITLAADEEGYYVMDSAVDEMGGDSGGFFPIDNELFGNEDNNHNFHFSTEIHAVFQYKSGDEFWFEGDDDVWIYLNDTLCVDLGGVHSASSAYISIDELVAEGKLNIAPGDFVYLDMFHMERHRTESNFYMKTNIDFVNFNNSDWATFELFEAYENDLIPERLMEEDLALPVYRDEFAATAVKLYEAMSGQEALPSAANPFIDTSDRDVLKAYQLGIVTGTSADTFAPREKLTRQEAAVMLTRVYKAVKLDGWTLAGDKNYRLEYTMPEPFADDANIDDWARDSVYFMVANGVINGVGNHEFAPKNVTDEQNAANFANASREQALVISVRSFKKLR